MRRALRWTGGIALLLAAGTAGALAWLTERYRPAGEREAPAAVAAEATRLRAARDSLTSALRTRIDADPILGTRPPGDVVIGLPTALVRGVAHDVSTQYFHDVDLTLRNITVHKTGDVRAKVRFLGKRRVGTYDLALTIDSVRGRLQPGEPTLGFGDGRITVRLPVRIAGGGGRATIRLGWDSKGLASPVCGDLHVTRVVTGRVQPATYDVRGLIELSALNGTIVADPDFPELALRLFIVPSEGSLATLDSALHLKGKMCDVAVDKIDVRAKILGLVDRGFNVKIPQRFFRPIRMPIAVRTTLPLPGRDTPLDVRPSGLRVNDRIVWLGADVRVGRASAPAGARVVALPSTGPGVPRRPTTPARAASAGARAP